MFAVESSLLAKVKKPQFPEYAVALVKKWQKQRLADSAASEARYLQRNVLLERRDDLSRRYRHYVSDKESGGPWNADAEAQLQAAFADYQEAVKDLAEFDAEKANIATTRPMKPRRTTISYALNAEDWFRELRQTQFFRHVEVPLPTPKKGESLTDMHERFCEDADAVMDRMAETEGAPLPVDAALTRYRAEVEHLAKQGAPRISELFRAYPYNGGAHFEQSGHTHWPKRPLLHVGMENEVSTERGIALIAAIFTDHLLQYGERLIRAKAKEFKLSPIPLAERKERLIALGGELLLLHRQIERIESEMMASKSQFDAFPGLSVFAVLRIEPDPTRKLPNQEGRGSLVQADKKFIAARS